jgi:Co/Zn/Cd efflux system component
VVNPVIPEGMLKTTFKISKMDCPSEEQIIRMKLDDLSDIQALDFDIGNRQLTVFHTGHHEQIFQRLNSLQLDTSFLNSEASENQISPPENIRQERKLLGQVLAINVFFFVVELFMGIFSHSMGLLADSLDMLADSLVYGLALVVVGGSLMQKRKIATAAGYFQLTLALLGFIEVIRRFTGLEPVPDFQAMIIISFLALIGNALCLYLLQKSKSQEAHMKASMIFTSNDVIVNVGVILAGGLVYLTQSKYPDLVIGTIVFFIVGTGALRILKLSNKVA